MSIRYVLELDLTTHEHIAWHKFELSGYRNILKFSGIFENLQKHRNRTPTRLYSARFEDDFEIEMKSHARQNYPIAPIIEHASLDAFFEHIGYDYKTKKIT